MRYKVKYYLICTYLCAPFFSSGQVALGDSLSALGNYQHAVIAYEYALFQGLPASKNSDVLIKSSMCLKQLGKYNQALMQLDAVNLYQEKDSVGFLMLYEYAVNALLANKPDLAFSKIQEAYYEINDSLGLAALAPFEILALNEMQRWEEAHSKYLQFAKRYAIVYDPYPEILAYKMKDPKKAITLSYWLPGVGQMYAGYFWKGFFSTILNIGLAGFSGWSIWNGYFFSGAFTGTALFYLSYNGGARYAEVLANQYNAQTANTFKAKVRNLIVIESTK